MRIRRGAGAVVAAGILAVPAGADYAPKSPPESCAGNLWADQIGTSGSDSLAAARRPERLWGRDGNDRLTGSATRATCLLGGRGNDALRLGEGGGIAYGESGADFLLGSALDDQLHGGAAFDRIDGGPGRDVIDGGAGVDRLRGGAGDDLIDAEDGQAELVDCGDGDDLAAADGVDQLLGCEAPRRSGGPLPSLTPVPRAAQSDQIVRIRFRAPERGAYRVVMTRGCAEGAEITRTPTVRKGRVVRLGLRPPAGGWCAGELAAAVVRAPGEPIARLRFTS